MRIDPSLAGYKVDQLKSLYRHIRERLARLPGALNVCYSLYSPMSGSNWTTDVTIDGQRPPSFDGQNLTSWNRVGPDYFETIGTPLLHGRPITELDTETTRHVAVINEAFARRFFPGENPIGKHFGAREKFAKAFEVVGVAADAKYRQPGQPAFPMYFVPRTQVTPFDDPGTMSFETRSLYVNDIVLQFAAFPACVEQQIRSTFAEIDPNLPVIRVQRFDTQAATQISQESLIARLTSLFGLTALLLASIGLYGINSFSVAQRSREIAISVALGADRMSVVKLVLRSAYFLVAIGLVLGIPLALGMGWLLGSWLFAIRWYSPAILVGAAIALALCALVATIAPARRAAALDPIETLGCE